MKFPGPFPLLEAKRFERTVELFNADNLLTFLIGWIEKLEILGVVVFKQLLVDLKTERFRAKTAAEEAVTEPQRWNKVEDKAVVEICLIAIAFEIWFIVV